MKKRVLAGLCAFLLVLSGCGPVRLGAGTDTARTLTVYRLAEDRAADALTGQELCPIPADAGSDVQAAVELFASPCETEGLTRALPAGVTVRDWTLENGVVTLTLSESFLDASPMERTAAALCAALTLCGLEGVESVDVSAGGRTLFSGLTGADALLRDTDTDPFVRRLRLYFTDGTGRYLTSEYHSLTLAEDAAADRYVMEELLRGPNSAELSGAVPEGTALLSCATEDGICTVDLSAAFYEGRPRTALAERLAVYSIVDSLTALPQVDSVRVLVEGQPVDTYVYLSLAEPLARYERAVRSGAAGRETADVDLYLPLPGLEAIAPLPWQVPAGAGTDLPEAVLEALLEAEEPGYPQVFPGGAPGPVTVEKGTCTVELTESFLASLAPEARPAAVQAIGATLCALEDVDRVCFTVDGGPALFDGTDWSGPWESFDLAE